MTSSYHDSACAGDEVTFTCTALNTQNIQWEFLGKRARWIPTEFIDSPVVKYRLPEFTAVLTRVEPSGSGSYYDMTATLATTASLDNNGSTVRCKDSMLSSAMLELSLAGN